MIVKNDFNRLQKRYVLLLMKVSHHYCPPSKSFPPSLMQSLISPDQSIPPLLWRKISISYKKKTSPEGDPPLFSSVQFFPTSVMQSLISPDKSVPQMLWRTISISYKKENFSWRCPTIVHHCPILSPLSDAIPNFPGRRSGSPSKARLPRPNPSLMSLKNKTTLLIQFDYKICVY